mmetsp:Transcript_27424/g.88561  ORF Transcript_27424/g.88561 Transcript_27424/m.88561 type:complete len:221 (+) Transcript_27424:979-1641(+)
MATRSTPTPTAYLSSPRARAASVASFSFVPTPSVPDTRSTSSPPNPAADKSNTAPKPPIASTAPATFVAAARGLIRSTRAFPATMSTPAERYVSGPSSDGGGALVGEAAALALALAPRDDDDPPKRLLLLCSPTRSARGTKRSPASPLAKRRTAAMRAGPSMAWTRALRASGVLTSTAHVDWQTTAPPSTSSVTRWTVQPDSVLPSLRTASWTARSMPPA